MKPYLWITPLIFLGLGILSPIVGVLTYNRDTQFSATAEHATATLEEYVPDPNPKASDFCPRYEFTTAAGQTVSYVGDECLSDPDPSRIGQTTEAYYSPNNPQSIYDKPNSTGDLIIGGLGCLLFPLIGAAILGFNLWQERRKQGPRRQKV